MILILERAAGQVVVEGTEAEVAFIADVLRFAAEELTHVSQSSPHITSTAVEMLTRKAERACAIARQLEEVES